LVSELAQQVRPPSEAVSCGRNNFSSHDNSDLGTPYSASDYSLARLDVTPQVMARVQHHYYDAGHMM
jgi:hypothetical protein